jgi:hypothetical protein
MHLTSSIAADVGLSDDQPSANSTFSLSLRLYEMLERSHFGCFCHSPVVDTCFSPEAEDDYILTGWRLLQ